MQVHNSKQNCRFKSVVAIGISRRKCLEGQCRGNVGAGNCNHWIVNTRSAGRTYISPRKLSHTMQNIHFCCATINSLSKLYTWNMWLPYWKVLFNVTVLLKNIDLSLAVLSEGWGICTKWPNLHLSLHEY